MSLKTNIALVSFLTFTCNKEHKATLLPAPAPMEAKSSASTPTTIEAKQPKTVKDPETPKRFYSLRFKDHDGRCYVKASEVAFRLDATQPTSPTSVPFVTTQLAEVTPNASWMLSTNTAQVRKSGHKNALEAWILGFAFDDGGPLHKTGLELSEINEVMISTPNAWRTKDRFAFVVRLSVTQEQAKKKMEATASKAGTKLVSAKLDALEVWRWESEAKLGAASQFVFYFLSKDTLIIAAPATMSQAIAKKETPPNNFKTILQIPTEQGEVPTFLFLVDDIDKTFPLKSLFGVDWGGSLGFLRLPPKPQYVRIAVQSNEKVNISVEASFPSEAEAVSGAASLNALMSPFYAVLKSKEPSVRAADYAALMRFKPSGSRVRTDLEISAENATILLQDLLRLTKGDPTPPSTKTEISCTAPIEPASSGDVWCQVESAQSPTEKSLVDCASQ